MKKTTSRTLTNLLSRMLGLTMVISIAPPALAKIDGCDTSTETTLSACTDAQQTAYRYKEEADNFQTTSYGIGEDHINSYVQYLDLVIQGYTPNDEEYQSPEAVVESLIESFRYSSHPFSLVEFGQEDVFPGFEFNEEEFNSDISDTKFMYDIGSWKKWPLDWARDHGNACESRICNGTIRTTDRVVELLGGGSKTKEDLYVENGYRTTGFDWGKFPDDDENLDYRALGVWAQDSYWGFWEYLDELPEDYEYLDEAQLELLRRQGLYDTSKAVFIAGGRNPSRPGTGTWKGLAVAKYEGGGEVQVGHSEIIVNLDASEVDVNISGLAASNYATVIEGFGTTLLTWKGLPLDENGFFHDPRRFGVHSSLRDVFAAELLPVGSDYTDTANSIRGQFYGENGDEVTGTFNHGRFIGSFGAYQEATGSEE